MALPLASQTVLLNDGTHATIHPVWNGSQLPLELVAALCVEYNAEIDRGQSFPETQKMMLENFEKSWFAGVTGVMIRGEDTSQTTLEDFDLLDNNECLGSFWIQPCYPGRSSHVCTANLLVKSKFRNHGVGKAMGQCFLRWALQLGYDYALFTLVYDCNVAACKILDKLGFSVLGVIKGAGILKGFNHPVDAFMFGRSLVSSVSAGTPGATHTHANTTPGSTRSMNATPNTIETEVQPPAISAHTVNPSSPLPIEYEDLRTYLMQGVYPPDLNRTEKTRIRSRARSYEVKNGVLYFKRTQTPVIADEREQLRIVDELHQQNHNGINKLQKQVVASYHWPGIRETIGRVIKQCPQCRAANNPSRTLEASRGQTGQQYTDSRSSGEASAPSTSPLQFSLAYADVPGFSNIVYLPPENEDDEYIPEDADVDLGLDDGQYEADSSLIRNDLRDDEGEDNDDDDDDDEEDEYEDEWTELLDVDDDERDEDEDGDI